MQKIKPYTQPSRKVFVATFEGRDGKRVTRSLGTDDELTAWCVANELRHLSWRNVEPGDKLALAFSPMAYRAWFGVDQPPGEEGNVDALKAQIASLSSELEKMTKRCAQLEDFKERYQSLSRGIEGARIEASRNSPTLAEVKKAYEKEVSTLARKGSANVTWFKRFSEFIGANVKVADIKPAKIIEFLRWDASEHKEPTRYARTRGTVSHFYSWCAIHHAIPSPMDQIPGQRQKAAKDIHWHSLEEAEEVLAGIDPYWRALVGCMAFAGLSAGEIRGLRRRDVTEIKGIKHLRVAATEDRDLKTHNRARTIGISPRLLPLLDARLKDIKGEDDPIFPPTVGVAKIWTPDGLTTHLGKHLPKGMDARSLRRTFGSLLIRSGKSAEEVAAAMGNTAAMVQKHYARIIGSEVDIDF